MHYLEIKKSNAELFQSLKQLLESSDAFGVPHLSLVKKYSEQIADISKLPSEFVDSSNIKMLSFSAISQLFDIAKRNNYPVLTTDSLAMSNFSCVQLLKDGGFSNRIRALVSLEVICNFFEYKKINRLWLPDESCPCEFADIFNNSLYYNFVTPNHVSEYLLDTIDKCVSSDIFSQWAFWENFLKPSGLSWPQFNTKYKEELVRLFENVSTDIGLKVFSISKNFSKNCLGVHVRTTDFSDHYKAVYPDRILADVDAFVGYIKNNFSDANSIYLATDNPSLIDSFKKSIEIPVLSNYTTELSNKLRLTSVSDSVVDLLCLSRCNTILGTYGSSFSELAADIGNINRVTI